MKPISVLSDDKRRILVSFGTDTIALTPKEAGDFVALLNYQVNRSEKKCDIDGCDNNSMKGYMPCPDHIQTYIEKKRNGG